MSNYIQSSMTEYEKCKVFMVELNRQLFEVEDKKRRLEVEIEFLDKKLTKFHQTHEFA